MSCQSLSDCTIYYFEATFSSTSDADDDAMRGDDGEISLAAGIGLVMPSFPLDRCPGNSPGSVGYRGDGKARLRCISLRNASQYDKWKY